MRKLKGQDLAHKITDVLKLKVVAKKLQLEPKNQGPRNRGQEAVPEDVKEGCFAVIAVDDGEERRIVVPLASLKRPSFQRLLVRAAEEYGFNHDGVLMVPCRPSELEQMLDSRESGLGMIPVENQGQKLWGLCCFK